MNALVVALQAGGGIQNLDRFAATPAMREKLRKFEDLIGQQSNVNTAGIAFALQAAANAAVAVGIDQSAEIVWTGPATEAVPLRRVDQVIYDMVEGAQKDLLLVTYAAYRAERALDALRDATERGVVVKLVIELAQASGGKISFDGLHMFRTAVPTAQVFYWPLDRRKRDVTSSAYGAMHAKCVVADRNRAIISSANMTDYALQLNMELGLLVGRNVASALAEHFDQLILRRELVKVP
jgi:phosphatidylserine/phosphatidylglycerophosphate/cardiolipin synthase-like enzyme